MNIVRNGRSVAVVSNNNAALQNIVEKLETGNVAFLTAFLGNRENQQIFLKNQTAAYPEERNELEQEISSLSKEINKMMSDQNRIAEIEQQLLLLRPEKHYFEEHHSTCKKVSTENLEKLFSKEILSLWT